MGNLAPASQSSAQDAKLLLAIEEANLERLQKAMRKGANIRTCVYPGLHPTRQSRIPTVSPPTPPLWSALMRAAYHGHNPIVQILLAQGVDIGLQAWDGTTALMLAAQEGHLHVVQELCKAVKHPIMQPGSNKQIPPQPPPQQIGAADASGAGSMEESPQIVPRSASSFHPVLDAIDDKGQTALLRAAALGHGACMETLLIAGANVCIADRMDGMTALAWAAEHGPSRLVLLCIQAGSNINRKNHNGQTPLLCAASKDYDYSGDHQQLGVGVEDRHLLSLDETRRLGSGESIEESKSMSHAVSSASSGGGGRFASSASPSSIVLTLLQNGGDANAANHDKVTALMVAAWKGHSAVVDLLIAHRANLNARAERGQTALMLAAAQAHSRCAETLITAGALLDVVDEKGQTALHKAAVRGDTHTAECLVRAGADVRLAESVNGNTALQLAAQNLHSSIVELLLRGGRGGNRADPCVRNHRGESALMLAAARGHSYTVACLLKGGAAPDLAAADDAGNSVLMLAARAGSEPVVELLLDCASVVGPGLPALLAARNHADECALDLALQQRHAPVVELLIAAGSDAHLLVPSSNGSAGGQTAAHIFSMLLQHASLKEAVDRGLAMRDRFETREKRYKDVVALLEQQQQRLQSMQDAAASSSSSSSLDGIEIHVDHSNGAGVGGPNSPGGGRRQTPSHSQRQSNAVDGSSIRSVSGDNPSAAAASSARRTQPTLLTRHSSDLSNDSSSSPAHGAAAASTSSASAAPAAQPSSVSSRPILEWSVPQVLLWLQSLSLSSYTQSFSDAAIDGEMLLEFLRNEDLLESELGITRKIHRIKILREIKKMVPNSNGNGNGNGNGHANGVTNGSSVAAASPATAEATVNGSCVAARPSSHSAVSDSKDAAVHDHAAAATASSVPLTTSISNPLPTPSGAVAATGSNGVATTSRFQQQQLQQPPSSASLFPAPLHTAAASSPALSASSAAVFPAPASAAASSSAVVAAPAAKPAPQILTSSAAAPSIFSAGFDFDNLSGLAPLSATSAASSGPSSNASSAAPTPSGSGDKMPTMAEQPRIGGQQNSLSSSSSSSGANHQSPQPPQQQPQPSSTHHLQVRPAQVIAQEYSPMHQTDLLMEPPAANGVNGHANSAATGSSIINSNDAHPAPDSLHATPAPSPSSSLRPLPPPHHSPRRIPYSELVLKEIIGQGQFGTVWLGSWRGAAVAVKKLHLAASVLAVSAATGASGNSGASNSSGKQLRSKDGSGSGGSNIAAEQMALFLQEASLMELLGNHPNLISFVGISLPDTPPPPTAPDGSASAASTSSAAAPSILSFDEPTQGDVCIVTQYFPLGSIRDLLITKRTLGKIPPSVLAAAVEAGDVQSAQATAAPPSPLPLLTLLRMLRDISCGVLHLHLEHCIHRDLAARNFLVDEYSLSVRVADFGMSRFLQAAQQTAPNRVPNGTNGNGAGNGAALHSAFTHSQVGPLKWMSPESILRHEYSSASDAYSFGIACWELLAQSEPYPEQLALEAAIRAAHEPSFRPVIPNYVPKPLAELMQQCWAHAPKDRPTFAHILAQLERMEAHLKGKLKAKQSISPWSEACWDDYALAAAS